MLGLRFGLTKPATPLQAKEKARVHFPGLTLIFTSPPSLVFLGPAVGSERRRRGQRERPDRVQRVDRCADARSRHGGGDEEQQRGGGLPRGRLRHGGQRGVLDQRQLQQLREQDGDVGSGVLLAGLRAVS